MRLSVLPRHGSIQDAHRAGEPHKHEFLFELACHFGAISVTGVSAVSKFDGQDAHVVTYTSALVLAGTDLRFRETVWMVMTELKCDDGSGGRTGSLPQQALMQTCYRMQSERPSARTQADASYFQDFVLHAQSERMRSDHLRLQTLLLETIGAAAAHASTTSRGVDVALECVA